MANRDRIDLSQPHLQGVDKLCPPSSIKNGTCTIKNKDIRLTYDFVYESQNNLIFDNTEVQCVTTTNFPCALHLKLTDTNSLTLQNKSKFEGKQILIEAHQSNVAILDSSTLSVSGQSMNQNGTQVRPQDGAQFVGQGGACGVTSENYTTFGNFDMMPDFDHLASFLNQMGSIGQPDDAETAGGGRMVILADSIQLTGWGSAIQANARPFAEVSAITQYHLVGGSGGYIYIKTNNKLKDNELGDKFRVEAQGGHGTHGNYGGSGGVIIFDGGFSVRHEQVTAAGGSSLKASDNLDGCGNGAAGTLFYRHESKLVVDNENKPTPKKTVLRATNPNKPGDGHKPSVLAKIVQVVGAADVWVDSNANSWLKFDDLTVTDDAILGIVTSNMQAFTLSLGDEIKMSKNATLDLSRIWDANLNATNWWTNYSLGHIKYGRILKVSGGFVSVFGNVTLATVNIDYDKQNSKVLFNTETLTLAGNQTLQAAQIFAYTSGDMHLQDGFRLESFSKGSCATLEDTPTMFSCVPMKSLGHIINSSTFLEAFNQSFKEKATAIHDTITSITQSYQIYLASESGIHMSRSSLHAPRIGMCAPNINSNNTLVNAAEKGCPAGYGIGKGQTPMNCSGAGGAHGGAGGIGLAHAAVSCASGVPHSYFHENQAVYEGSSGGSAIPGSNLGGNGGGIIWLSASETITLNSTELTVRGQHGRPAQGRYGSGGGAGGSIQIITKNIAGDASLDLSGGDGSVYGGGGGSGGRFVSHLLQSFNASNFKQQSLRWNGTINLDGGRGGARNIEQSLLALEQSRAYAGNGEDGTTAQEKCFGGFTGPFCKPCKVGTFKYNFGYGVCQPCTNKPVNSFYNNIAQSTAKCSYQCVEGFESVDVNPQCLNSLDLQVERVGGAEGFLIIFGFFFILTFCLWIIIGARSSCIKAATKDYYSTVYDGVLFADHYEETEEGEGMVGPATLHMRDGDIWSHTHRMYMIGENSVSYPWFLTRDFPTNALNEHGKQKLLRFIKKDQYVLDWTRCQTFSYYLVRIFFPYWAEALHKSYRRKHFRAASTKLYESFDVTDWEDITGRTVRISADQDSRLAYVDFLDYRKNKVNFQGPQLPITLLLAGNGTLSTPYKLNFLDDPLAKSLVYLNKDILKTKLPPFLQNLNTLLDKLCFYKFNRQTMKDLNDVIEWIELGNKTLFSQLDVKMQLYVFENSYQEVAGGDFRQRRRSMPLENKVFESFPALFKRLIQHVQLKLLTKHSEIKLGIVVRSTSQQQEKKVEQKIRKISESLGGRNENILSFESATLSSLYDDDEDAGDFAPSKTQAKKGSLKSLDRQNDMSESLISDSNMEVSQVMIHGTDIQTEVRIIDKSKRAYDISVESTKALEKALQKDKKRCKHNCARTKSVFYSLWIMLFKLHGIPPTIRLNTLFMFFSMTLAFELILTMVFLLHIMNPITQVWNIGFTYLFILPGLTLIAPLWGLAATCSGSPQMMKTWATMNTSMVALNYPLTIITLWWFSDQAVYVAVLLLLIFNKMCLSFYGSKVRQHFANPAYAKTQEKMQVTLSDMIAADRSGRSRGLTPAQRAAMLVQSGKPDLDSDNRSGSSGLLDEDEDDYGIVPTKSLQKQKAEEGPQDFGNFDVSDPTVAVPVPDFVKQEPVVPETKQDDVLDLFSQELPVKGDQPFDLFAPEPNEPTEIFDSKLEDGDMSNSLLSSILTQAASHEPVEESNTVKAGEDQ